MRLLHVLIIPGDSYRFELTQALGLKEHDVKVGFLSIEILQPYKSIVKTCIKKPALLIRKLYERLRKSKKIITSCNINGIDSVKAYGSKVKPHEVVNKQKNIIDTALIGFGEYVKKFGKPNLIHAHSRFLISALIANQIGKKFNIPYVVTEHSSFYFRNLVANDDYRAIREVLNEATRWIAVSTKLGEYIKKKVDGINKDFIEIPNAVEKEFELAGIGQRIISNTIKFLNIADLNKNKRHDLLIEAFDRGFNAKHGFHLLIGGVGPQKACLEKAVKEKGLDAQVHFLGALSRNEVVDRINECDFFVVSSDFETFSVVTIEALALGKPVVSTRCGGPEEIVNDKNGILVPKGDVEALAYGMYRIYKNCEDYDPVMIRKECLEKYSTDVVTAKLISLYNQVLTEQRTL